MITYGSPVWTTKTGKSIQERKLKSIQRIPLLKISKAFRTVSNQVLNIVTNIIPIAQTIEKENELFQILNYDKQFSWQNKQYKKGEIIAKANLWEVHPAKTTRVEFKTKITKSDFYIYTDGSQVATQVGAAFVVFDSINKIVHQEMYKLPEHSNNFIAETTAIERALKYIGKAKNNAQYQILTDSLSTLQGLNKSMSSNFFINNLKKEILNLTNTHSITFNYVRGHSGIVGNEIADDIANKARLKGTEIDIPITKRFIKTELRKSLY